MSAPGKDQPAVCPRSSAVGLIGRASPVGELTAPVPRARLSSELTPPPAFPSRWPSSRRPTECTDRSCATARYHGRLACPFCPFVMA